MADFPTNLKAFTTHNIGDVINPDFDNEQQAEIEALEAKVGVDGSAVTTSHDYKLGEVTGSDKAVGKSATQTLTNKTLTTPTITTPKITVGGDAVGDLHYKSNVDGTQSRIGIGSASQVLTVSGGIPSWQTPASITDASTTAKGVVEAATSAEVTAGTATGGTGAVLVVTPDALAASTPVFSGLGLTNTTRTVRLAGYTSTKDTTENTVYTTTISANTLSTNGVIEAYTPVELSSNSTAETFTIRLKFGGSTLASITQTISAVGGGSNSTYSGMMRVLIVNNASASSQNVSFNMTGGILFTNATNLTPNYTSNPADTTSSIDTTSNQTLTVTVQRTTGTVNTGTGTFKQTLVKTIKNV